MSEAHCPKCKRPWRPRSILLSDLPLYCRQTDDLECVTAQRDALEERLAAWAEKAVTA